MSVIHEDREYPCVESMTRLRIGSFDVRVWRDESSIECYDNTDLLDMQSSLHHLGGEACEANALAIEVAKADRVSAVEVLRDGDGIVLYTMW